MEIDDIFGYDWGAYVASRVVLGALAEQLFLISDIRMSRARACTSLSVRQRASVKMASGFTDQRCAGEDT